MTKQFPDGFIWGASTASYQIEGAARKMAAAPAFGIPSATLPAKSRTETPEM